jgi:hypothetical protein
MTNSITPDHWDDTTKPSFMPILQQFGYDGLDVGERRQQGGSISHEHDSAKADFFWFSRHLGGCIIQNTSEHHHIAYLLVDYAANMYAYQHTMPPQKKMTVIFPNTVGYNKIRFHIKRQPMKRTSLAAGHAYQCAQCFLFEHVKNLLLIWIYGYSFFVNSLYRTSFILKAINTTPHGSTNPYWEP